MQFWDRIENLVRKRNTSFRWIAESIFKTSETTISGMRKHGIFPRAPDAVGLAREFDTTVEELVLGEAGRAYVVDWAGQHGAQWRPPGRLDQELIDDLMAVDDTCLEAIKAMAKRAAEIERAKRGVEPRAPASNQNVS